MIARQNWPDSAARVRSRKQPGRAPKISPLPHQVATSVAPAPSIPHPVPTTPFSLRQDNPPTDRAPLFAKSWEKAAVILSVSAMPGYYDINDILMEEEPISVIFHVTANGVGLLDPGAETNCVEKGAKVDLPFWLAHGLLSMEQAVSINVPPCFTQKTRKEIQADAACVDLRVRCPYFYELGCKIVPLVTDKSIGMFLRYTFTSRYKEILSKSHSSSVMTTPKFVPRLTREETLVFEYARESMAAFKKWRTGGVRMQKASILGRKRKTKLSDGSSTP